MIHYQLRCDQAHEFDGWFNNSAGFEKQAKRGLIECPTCGGTKVARALMAPALTSRDQKQLPPSRDAEPATQSPPSMQRVLPPAPAMGSGPQQGPIPARMLAMLQRLRAEVEKNCDYVGPSFADEARKIHHGEAEERGIYGETTPDEAESLAEEGIMIQNLPWVPPADG